jgi:hypothetical protein
MVKSPGLFVGKEEWEKEGQSTGKSLTDDL